MPSVSGPTWITWWAMTSGGTALRDLTGNGGIASQDEVLLIAVVLDGGAPLRIAVLADSRGEPVLVRPNSIIVDVAPDGAVERASPPLAGEVCRTTVPVPAGTRTHTVACHHPAVELVTAEAAR